MKVLVVEPNERAARFLARVFKEQDYVVDSCGRGAQGVDLAKGGAYDVIVAEWSCDMGGATVCRALRAAGVTTPILILTSGTNERVTCLNAGADDCLTKPFEIAELIARVRALLRRAARSKTLHCGDLDIDCLGHVATLRGVPLDLSAKELALLIALATRAGHTVTRSELLERVWMATFESDSNLIDVHMSHLRAKLGAHRSMIETVRGKGYRLRTR